MLWWQTGVIYQIYPRSFKDTTGNGVGDLRGIIEKLDYVTDTLGVDAVWISPFYPSPMADFGYDVSDYTDIHPLFGDLETFDELVARRTIHPTSTPGFKSRGHPGITPGATGMSGSTQSRMVLRRTTGRASSGDPPGSGMKRPSSTTCIPS